MFHWQQHVLWISVITWSFLIPGINSTLSTNKDKRFTILTQLEDPYVMINNEGDFTSIDNRFKGYIVDVLKRVSQLSGFQFTLKLDFGETIGVQSKENHSHWSGMIGSLLDKQCDMLATTLTPTEKNEKYIDFTDGFLYSKSRAILKISKRKQKKTIIDLFKSSFRYGTIKNSYTEKSMMNSSNRNYNIMYTKVFGFWPPTRWHNIRQAISQVRSNDDLALILDSPKAEYLVNNPPCDLYTTSEFLTTSPFAFATRRGAPILRKINRALKDMRAGEEMQQLYRKWWVDACQIDAKLTTATPTQARLPWRSATRSISEVSNFSANQLQPHVISYASLLSLWMFCG